MGINLLALGASMKYTADTAEGMGAVKGKDGDSAYAVAVKNGFSGSQTKWLESLKGEKGDTPTSAEMLEAVEGALDGKTIYKGDDNLIHAIGGGKGADTLDGKKIAFIGDSITFGTGSSSATTECDGYNTIYGHKQSFPEVIKELHPTAHVYNYGAAGLPITQNSSGSNLLSIFAKMANEVSDVDYVMLSGGVNDAWVSGITLGTLETGYSGGYDKTTFYGALQQYIYDAVTAYPNAYICFVMTHNNISRNFGNGIVDMNAVIREVCAKWKIRIVDFNKNIGVNLAISPYNAMYMADATHPNEQCYRKYYAPQIIEALLDYGVDTSNGQTPPTPPDPPEPTKELVSISATKTVTEYNVGDTLSTSDITVTALYSDGSTENVTSAATINASSVVMSTAGTYNINISYGGKSTTLSITVTGGEVVWDDEITLTGTWNSQNFAAQNFRIERGENHFHAVLIADQTVSDVQFKFAAVLGKYNFVKDTELVIDVDITHNQAAVNAPLNATAVGQGTYPVNIKMRDASMTQ